MIRADTVHGAFSDAAARWPDRPFLNVLPETADIYGIDAGEITFAQAAAEVGALRDRIGDAGYRTGQRVMLLMENRPAFFLWWLAFNAHGVSVVPINPDLRAAELAYMIGHAEPVLAVVLPGRVDDLRAAALEAGVEMPVITPEGALPPAPEARMAAARDGAPEAAMLYTSGSTGKPKGCILTDDYFITAGNWYTTTGGLIDVTEDGERMITPLPIFHMNAMACSFMAMISIGGCLTALDRFHPRSWWQSVRASRATCLHYLGVMPSMLMGADPGPGDRDHSVRFGFGAGVDPKLHAPFEDRFGFPLIEAWAMTETGNGAVLAANRLPRRVGESCLGKPEGGMEMRIVDDAGHEVAQGELLVRQKGPDPRKGFFAGYFKNDAATAEAWEGGWFHTGDIVRQEEDGNVFFVDRVKNVIRRSGENIAAVEVESALARHPQVGAVAVCAVPDDVRGDEVFALIVPKGGAQADEITGWCLGQLAYYKAPGYIAFVDALPLTGTQKLQRGTIKEMAADMVARGAAIDTRHLKKRGAA
jgi:acyl-CoA synthetase (AMP-forming)/AMP-acid ligase II